MFTDLLNKYRNLNIMSRMGRVRVVKMRTTLIAQKKVLCAEGVQLLNDGASLPELIVTRPGLWIPDKKGLRIRRDKVVTTAFVEFVVDQLIAETSVFGDFKYHHSGTGVGAEAVGDTDLGTPVEDAREIGTQAENAATIYQSVATETYGDTYAVTEHGLFNTAGAGGPPVTGGLLMDRTVFAAINVVATNQIQFTFLITFAAGG